MRPQITDGQIRSAWLDPNLREQMIDLPADWLGLVVRLRRGDAPAWVLRKTNCSGLGAEVILGSWPETPILEAMAKARVVRRKDSVVEGFDPPTVAVALANYWDKKLGRQKAGLTTWRSLRVALTDHMDRPILDITRDDIDALINRMAIDAPIHANRALAYLHAFFNWCIPRGHVDRNPASEVARIAIEKPRDRELSLHELIEIWWATDVLKREFRLAIRLMILTVAQRETVASMRASDLEEIEEGVIAWTPGGNGQSRVILREFATDPIYEAMAYQHEGSDLLFTTTGATPVSGWSRAKARLDKAIWERRMRRHGEHAAAMALWRLNDFRVSFYTLAREQLHEDPAVLERCLGRISRFSEGAREWALSSEMDAERDRALAKWANLIEITLAETRP